jgi:hypothetical protein
MKNKNCNAYLVHRYQCLSGCEAHNRFDLAEATVAPKLNQTSSSENALYSFSDALFWFFFGQAKKNNNKNTKINKVV